MIKEMDQKQQAQGPQFPISCSLSQTSSQHADFQLHSNNSMQSSYQPPHSLPFPPPSTKQSNRRYNKLKQLCKQGYFDQEYIMLKYPTVYYEYVGKYKRWGNGQQFTSVSEFLQAQILNTQYRELLKKCRNGTDNCIDNIMQFNEQLTNTSPSKCSRNPQGLKEKGTSNSLHSQQYQYDQQLQSIGQQDLELQQQSLIDYIYQCFLGGRLPGFDYRQMDEDEGLDDWKLMDLDEEERYFSEGIEDGKERDPVNNTGVQDF